MTTPTHSGDLIAAGLRNARETERVSSYLRDIWRRRHYSWYVAKSELRGRQINSVLGNIWLLLNPLLSIGVFFLFFGVILDTNRGVDNFLGYLSIGIFTYTFTQKAVMIGAKSLIKYRGLIQIVAFPRATLPLTTTLTETLATVPPYIVMFIVAMLTGEAPALTWLLVIPLFAVQVVFTAGVALVTARMVSHLADVEQLLPFIFRLGFYASGVLFNVNAYLADSQYRVLFELNPLYCFIELNRGFILEGSIIDWKLAATASAWSIASIVCGFLWFRRAEDSYGMG